jgi:hypothetical protein
LHYPHRVSHLQTCRLLSTPAETSAYPESTTASPHLFRKLEVPGICVT